MLRRGPVRRRGRRTEEPQGRGGEETGRKEFQINPFPVVGGGLHCFMGGQAKEHLRKLEEEKENLQTELNSCSSHLDTSLNKYNNSQKVIQELNMEVSQSSPSRLGRGTPDFTPTLFSLPSLATGTEALAAHLLSFNG